MLIFRVPTLFNASDNFGSDIDEDAFLHCVGNLFHFCFCCWVIQSDLLSCSLLGVTLITFLSSDHVVHRSFQMLFLVRFFNSLRQVQIIIVNVKLLPCHNMTQLSYHPISGRNLLLHYIQLFFKKVNFFIKCLQQPILCIFILFLIEGNQVIFLVFEIGFVLGFGKSHFLIDDLESYIL